MDGVLTQYTGVRIPADALEDVGNNDILMVKWIGQGDQFPKTIQQATARIVDSHYTMIHNMALKA